MFFFIEPLDVGEVLQRESKALMDCGRSGEMLQLLRIVEPLGDLLRRVQMLRKEVIDSKVTCDSYISSSPEFLDSTEMPTTGNRNKEVSILAELFVFLIEKEGKGCTVVDDSEKGTGERWTIQKGGLR